MTRENTNQTPQDIALGKDFLKGILIARESILGTEK